MSQNSPSPLWTTCDITIAIYSIYCIICIERNSSPKHDNSSFTHPHAIKLDLLLYKTSVWVQNIQNNIPAHECKYITKKKRKKRPFIFPVLQSNSS